MSLEVAKIIISENTLLFSKPSDFNDPFDCDVDIVDFNFNKLIDVKVADEIKYIKSVYSSQGKDNSIFEDKNFLQRLFRNAQIAKINSFGICCFSLKYDIVLMWSHYADKHMGICLGFNNMLTGKFINLTEEDISEGQVEYKAREKINYVSENRYFAIRKLFLSKSKSWSHEKEYRMITLREKPKIQRFNPKFLSEVYFGLRVAEDQIRSFISLCSLNGLNHLKFYRASKHNLSIKFHQIQN